MARSNLFSEASKESEERGNTRVLEQTSVVRHERLGLLNMFLQQPSWATTEEKTKTDVRFIQC